MLVSTQVIHRGCSANVRGSEASSSAWEGPSRYKGDSNGQIGQRAHSSGTRPCGGERPSQKLVCSRMSVHTSCMRGQRTELWPLKRRVRDGDLYRVIQREVKLDKKIM